MQNVWRFRFIAAALAAFALQLGAAVTLGGGASPVDKVVKLLGDLKAGIEADGLKEQRSYDKSACWCEDTMERKAKDIATAKADIENLGTEILKLEGETAAHKAEIENLEKAVEANQASLKEAEENRRASHAEYENQKTEAEQSIGALETAITVLTGAGTAKGGFLEAGSMQEAKLLSVAAGVRPVLEGSTASHRLSDADLRIAQNFVAHPDDFMHTSVKRSGEMNAMQLSNNPFGDYAPQSTQIQGILKGLYDAFTDSLKKMNAEEAEEQKTYDSLMATKNMELKTLLMNLKDNRVTGAAKGQVLAESHVIRDDTQARLRADEAFFAETKDACKARAVEWSERSRLRSEETQGIVAALKILGGPEAQQIFENATTTLLQLSELRRSGQSLHHVRRGANTALKVAFGAAVRVGAGSNVGARAANVLKLAIKTASGGHFDSVLAAIDAMTEVLRKEEQDDIAHRDRCEGSTNKNRHDTEDLRNAIDKSNSSLDKLEHQHTELKQTKADHEEARTVTKNSLAELLELRNKEHDNFVKALADDSKAVELIDRAIVALAAFYKRNKIDGPKSFTQLQRPNYTIDKDQMPETTWSSEYTGKHGESAPVISLLATIKEDLQKEIVTGREDDAKAQAAFEKERATMQESVIALEKAIADTQSQLADVETKVAGISGDRSLQEAEFKEQQEMAVDLEEDCAWVKTEFDKRRQARKEEMAALAEAKSFLAGVESEGGAVTMDS